MEGGIAIDGGWRSSSSARGIGTISTDSGGRTHHAKPEYDPASLAYHMNGDRLLLIINNDTWKDSTATGFRQLPPRRDTECDVKRLQQCFDDVNFQVDKCNNFTCNEIVDKLKYVCEMDHSNTSCVAIAILTRGDHSGQAYAADKPYSLRSTIESLLLEPKLAGIPKLFFVQVCKRYNLDPGHRIQINGHVRVTVPTHSDCLLMMSNSDDQESFESGSRMIQTLCDVVEKHRRNRDLLHMVTLVHHQIAARHTKTTTESTFNKKQHPETRFTLTKLLKF